MSLPEAFGPFLLRERLAGGEVYLASPLDRGGELPDPLVVKRLPAGAEEERVRRFAHEALVASAVRSPHLAQLHDAGRVGATLYLAAEHVHGWTLAEVLASRVPIAARDAVAVAGGVIAGLAALHAARDPLTGEALGFVHRDISPSNAILGADGVARVIDLGLGRSAWSDWRTEPGAGAASRDPAYVAPESAADARSDVYACGALLRELLGGRVPPALEGVVRRATSRSARERYADAGELLAALDAAMQVRPRSAPGLVAALARVAPLAAAPGPLAGNAPAAPAREGTVSFLARPPIVREANAPEPEVPTSGARERIYDTMVSPSPVAPPPDTRASFPAPAAPQVRRAVAPPPALPQGPATTPTSGTPFPTAIPSATFGAGDSWRWSLVALGAAAVVLTLAIALPALRRPPPAAHAPEALPAPVPTPEEIPGVQVATTTRAQPAPAERGEAAPTAEPEIAEGAAPPRARPPAARPARPSPRRGDPDPRASAEPAPEAPRPPPDPYPELTAALRDLRAHPTDGGLLVRITTAITAAAASLPPRDRARIEVEVERAQLGGGLESAERAYTLLITSSRR